jgi:Reverse transcriptase (RNA-dependent DNA polymerase)
MANSFNKFFSNIGPKIVSEIPPSECDPLSFVPNYDDTKPLFYFDIPGPVHICDVVKSFDNKSSPDLDSISLSFVKKVIDVICIPLAHIFKNSLESGIFPEKLKSSRVVPIFKTGDPHKCDNYRPISLVSTISKILEKIVAIRLTNHLQLNNLICEHQYGFQRNMNTEHNLTQVISFISNALNKGNYCIGIFLDLKKAFDVCSHDILIKKTSQIWHNG